MKKSVKEGGGRACSAEDWEARERAVTLTNGQWSDLAMWLRLNARHAEGVVEDAKEVAKSWAEAAREGEDEDATYQIAVSTAEFWAGLNASVDEIRKAIDRA